MVLFKLKMSKKYFILMLAFLLVIPMVSSANPSVILTAPTGNIGPVLGGDILNLSWNVSDADGDLKSCRWEYQFEGNGSIDQDHTSGDDGSETVDDQITPEAQTFTTGNTPIPVNKIGVKLFTTGTPVGILNVSIWETNVSGQPVDMTTNLPLMINRSIDPDEFPFPSSGPGEFVNITFDETFTLDANTTYALVLVENGPGGGFYTWRFETTGTYAGGSKQKGGSGGVTWTNSTNDLMFEIYQADGWVTSNKTTDCAINTTEFTQNLSRKNIIFNAYDSLFNLNSTIISWDFKLNFNSESFSTTTLEGATDDFLANITLASGLTITQAVLFYNSTEITGESSESGDNIILRKLNIIVPSILNTINISFNWILTLSDASTINLTSNNQTVLNISMDNCTDLTNKIFSFTVRDEEQQTLLENNFLEILVNVFSVDRSIQILNFSGSFNNTVPLELCLNQNLTNATTSSYSFDSTIKYNAPSYATEYFNIVNFSLSNSSIFQNISLFDLLSADATEFKLTFTGTDFLPAEDVLVFVERQYISENTFKTVELPKTDTNGQTVLNLVRNDVLYNLIFVKDGVVLRNFINLRAFCDDATIGDCAINLNALSTEDDITNYDQELGIAFPNPPTFNSSTNKVSFTFISIDGSVKNVTMNVTRRDVFGNNSVCENSLISISGTLSCNIGSGITDTKLVTTISIDGIDKIISEVIIDNIAYGNFGYVAWFLISLGLVLQFSEDKNGILIGLLVGYIGSVGLGIITGGIIGLGSAGILIIIITLVGIWKLNKNKLD